MQACVMACNGFRRGIRKDYRNRKLAFWAVRFWILAKSLPSSLGLHRAPWRYKQTTKLFKQRQKNKYYWSNEQFCKYNYWTQPVHKYNSFLFKSVIISLSQKQENLTIINPPTFEQWTQRLRTMDRMANITSSLQLRWDIYLKRWSSLTLYLA